MSASFNVLICVMEKNCCETWSARPNLADDRDADGAVQEVQRSALVAVGAARDDNPPRRNLFLSSLRDVLEGKSGNLECGAVQKCVHLVSLKMLQNAYLLANISFDTTEKIVKHLQTFAK